MHYGVPATYADSTRWYKLPVTSYGGKPAIPTSH